MPDNTDNGKVLDSATNALRDSLAALEGEENRLVGELARVKDQRKNVARALESLTDTKPKRRRGRPRKSETQASEPVAA